MKSLVVCAQKKEVNETNVESWRWSRCSRHMNVAIPMVCREPQDHSSDCYFCITQRKLISSKSKHTVKYPNLPPAMGPVLHSEDLYIPHPPTHLTLEDESEHEAATKVPNEELDDATFETSTSSCELHLLTQGELTFWHRNFTFKF